MRDELSVAEFDSDEAVAEAMAGLDEAGRRSLAEGNRAYEERFGHVYLVRAAGRSGEELLALLRERLRNDPDTEAEIVRAQLAEITALRIEALWTP